MKKFLSITLIYFLALNATLFGNDGFDDFDLIGTNFEEDGEYKEIRDKKPKELTLTDKAKEKTCVLGLKFLNRHETLRKNFFDMMFRYKLAQLEQSEKNGEEISSMEKIKMAGRVSKELFDKAKDGVFSYIGGIYKTKKDERGSLEGSKAVDELLAVSTISWQMCKDLIDNFPKNLEQTKKHFDDNKGFYIDFVLIPTLIFITYKLTNQALNKEDKLPSIRMFISSRYEEIRKIFSNK